LRNNNNAHFPLVYLVGTLSPGSHDLLRSSPPLSPPSCCVYSLILYNRYTRENLPHHIHPNNLVAAFVMYASYFALFAKFAWDYWERLTLGSKIGTPKIKIQKSDGKKYSSPNSSTQNSRKKMKKQH